GLAVPPHRPVRLEELVGAAQDRYVRAELEGTTARDVADVDDLGHGCLVAEEPAPAWRSAQRRPHPSLPEPIQTAAVDELCRMKRLQRGVTRRFRGVRCPSPPWVRGV